MAEENKNLFQNIENTKAELSLISAKLIDERLIIL